MACILYRIGHKKTNTMLPIVLVLFVATSAFAAPSVVSLNLAPIEEFARPYDTGVGFNSETAEALFEDVDRGDTNIYTLTLEDIIKDVANQPNSYSQALAISQIIALLGEISYGIPGNACAAANAINQYTSGRGCKSYLPTIARNIDSIATLASNPLSIRFSSSQAGNCIGGGRTYQFEAAWSRILEAASPHNVALVNEEYCAAKRLYNALNIRSNNVAAAVTAASLPPVVDIIHRNIDLMSKFLKAAAKGNASREAVLAKNGLY